VRPKASICCSPPLMVRFCSGVPLSGEEREDLLLQLLLPLPALMGCCQFQISKRHPGEDQGPRDLGDAQFHDYDEGHPLMAVPSKEPSCGQRLMPEMALTIALPAVAPGGDPIPFSTSKETPCRATALRTSPQYFHFSMAVRILRVGLDDARFWRILAALRDLGPEAQETMRYMAITRAYMLDDITSSLPVRSRSGS